MLRSYTGKLRLPLSHRGGRGGSAAGVLLWVLSAFLNAGAGHVGGACPAGLGGEDVGLVFGSGGDCETGAALVARFGAVGTK